MKRTFIPVIAAYCSAVSVASLYAQAPAFGPDRKPDESVGADRPGGIDRQETPPAPGSVIVDCGRLRQRIRHFGASTGWLGGHIARHWPQARVREISRYLFSDEFSGNRPRGIGLSMYRIEIGAGTLEQGDASGIQRVSRRTACPLNSDGTYDWTRLQREEIWARLAAEFGVDTLLGYANSPPVHFTKNGYAYKTEVSLDSNLADRHYRDYADYLAETAAYYLRRGYPMRYISPVNEPQWRWGFEYGKAAQEGTPWANSQIARIARDLSAALQERGLPVRAVIPEAGVYKALSRRENKWHGDSSDQVREFWSPDSQNYVGDEAGMAPVVAGHAYWNDWNEGTMRSNRQALHDRVLEVDPGIEIWQTEYSLLGGAHGRLESHAEAAVRLARAIHQDLTIANVTSWQFWSSISTALWRPVPRFGLVRCDVSEQRCEEYRCWPTKLLWALGNYSLFIRPGYRRVELDGADEYDGLQASAYLSGNEDRLVMVMINASGRADSVRFRVEGVEQEADMLSAVPWITDAERDLERQPSVDLGAARSFPPKSITTLVVPLIPDDEGGS